VRVERGFPPALGRVVRVPGIERDPRSLSGDLLRVLLEDPDRLVWSRVCRECGPHGVGARRRALLHLRLGYGDGR
jgi:hypothetical protein